MIKLFKRGKMRLIFTERSMTRSLQLFCCYLYLPHFSLSVPRAQVLEHIHYHILIQIIGDPFPYILTGNTIYTKSSPSIGLTTAGETAVPKST